MSPSLVRNIWFCLRKQGWTFPDVSAKMSCLVATNTAGKCQHFEMLRQSLDSVFVMQLHLWDDSQLRHIWSECDTTHNVETLTDWWFKACYCGDCGAAACRLSHCLHLYSLSHELVSKSIIWVSFKLQGDFLNPKLLENCCQPLSSPLLSSLKRLALLFLRCGRQSGKLIALSLLCQMKDLGNVQVW